MALNDDLLAAQALIDTPAKRAAIGIYGALRAVAEQNEETLEPRFVAMQSALREQLPRKNSSITSADTPRNQRAVMAMFRRAVRALTPSAAKAP